MVAALFVAVLVLTSVVTVDFLLTLRLGRLVRDRPTTADTQGLAIGSSMPEFKVSTVDGAVSQPDLSDGAALFGFLTPSCRPCQESLPDFAQRAKAVAAAGGRVLAIVLVHPGDDADHLIEALPACDISVIDDDRHAPILEAFRIDGFPTYLRFDDGRLAESGPAVILDHVHG